MRALRHDRWQEWEAARRVDEKPATAPKLVQPEMPAGSDFADLLDKTPQPGSKLVH